MLVSVCVQSPPLALPGAGRSRCLTETDVAACRWPSPALQGARPSLLGPLHHAMRRAPPTLCTTAPATYKERGEELLTLISDVILVTQIAKHEPPCTGPAKELHEHLWRDLQWTHGIQVF